VRDERGRVLETETIERSDRDLAVRCKVPEDGNLTLDVSDSNYGGSSGHFYRINAGKLPIVRTVFPLGAARGETVRLDLDGINLDGTRTVSLKVGKDASAGSLLPVPVALPEGMVAVPLPFLVVAEGPQLREEVPCQELSDAQQIPVPGGVSGRIAQDREQDHYRFHARKGQRLVIETYAQRLGSPLDTAIELLDLAGRPVPRATLRPLDQTEIAFRDHDSTNAGIRLTRWNHLSINDYILCGREVARILSLPRNPDDDCIFWNDKGQRLGMLETTPEQHALSQPMYRVEVLPPGAIVSPGGLAPVVLNYRNDDGGPGYGKDSRLTFDPPRDGDYIVRVADVRGLGGPGFGYHLVLRSPAPDFRIAVSTENPNVPRGGTTLVGVTVNRIDGFDAAIEVRAEGLPPGVTATPAVIEPGHYEGLLALTADASAPAFSAPTWSLVSESLGSASGAAKIRRSLDPGGERGGWVTVVPSPNLRVASHPARASVARGEQVTIKLAVERLNGLSGRVPIEVRNLPQGVRVLDIGLSGVLVTETQNERVVRILAEPWVRPQTRKFYAVGKAEPAGTEHSSLPIELEVR
jgi:hypothetical protein